MHAPNLIWTWETERSRFFSPPFSCPHTIFSIFHLWFRGYILGEKSFIFSSSISSEKSYGLRAPFSMNNPLVYELYFRWEIPLFVYWLSFILCSHEKFIFPSSDTYVLQEMTYWTWKEVLKTHLWWHWWLLMTFKLCDNQLIKIWIEDELGKKTPEVIIN